MTPAEMRLQEIETAIRHLTADVGNTGAGLQGRNVGRALACARTKLDEARMWIQEARAELPSWEETE